METTQLTSLSKLVDIPIENHYDEAYLIRLGFFFLVLLIGSFNELTRIVR